MSSFEKVADNIYTFPIVLPNNPLKWLNCYVVRSDGRNLLIDTGFNRPECREALLDGTSSASPRTTPTFLSLIFTPTTPATPLILPERASAF